MADQPPCPRGMHIRTFARMAWQLLRRAADEWADRDRGRHARAADRARCGVGTTGRGARARLSSPRSEPGRTTLPVLPGARSIVVNHPHRLTVVSDSETHHRDVLFLP
jgi:hypothetical protein